ncbi:tyrosine-type recombinase/integrase [Actinobacillus suis]|uniref:tyrosine-type recombinase/integrase n=1 Tax=Actinobacillus suis TaxID=716 RepID=UPI001F071646|nr:site-specific integrase [Actinobacillus suis]
MYKKLRPYTELGYRKIFNLLEKTYPGVNPNDVTIDFVINWRNKVLQTAKPITWNGYARHLRSVYNFGIENGFLSVEKNPFSKVFITEDKVKKKTLTNDQVIRIIDFLSNNSELPDILKPSWFSLALIQTLRYTGMRRSQIIQLTIGDVDLEHKIIKISSHINKNHNYHEIPISRKLLPYLSKLVFELRQRNAAQTDQLFNLNLVSSHTRNRHKKTTRDQISHLIKVISKNVGFPISSHRFRHTIATQLMKNVDNVYNVKQLLGHSDIKVTLSYIEYNCEMIRNCVDSL